VRNKKDSTTTDTTKRTTHAVDGGTADKEETAGQFLFGQAHSAVERWRESPAGGERGSHGTRALPTKEKCV